MDFYCCFRPMVNAVYDYLYPLDIYKENFGGLLVDRPNLLLPMPFLESECECDSDYNKERKYFMPIIIESENEL